MNKQSTFRLTCVLCAAAIMHVCSDACAVGQTTADAYGYGGVDGQLPAAPVRIWSLKRCGVKEDKKRET